MKEEIQKDENKEEERGKVEKLASKQKNLENTKRS